MELPRAKAYAGLEGDDTGVDQVKAAWLELKARVEELASERQHYLEFFDYAPAAYLITRADGTIEDANGAAVDIFQRRRRHLQGKPLAALIALEQRAAFRDKVRSLGRPQAESSWRNVVEVPGTRLEVKLTARLIREPRGDARICWRVEALA